MTEYEWATTRDQAITLFNNDVPGAQLEQDIIGHFLQDPERVIRTIHRIADQPDVRSPWAVLRADLSRAAQANVTADNTRARTKALDRGRNWIDNAGVHYDDQRHIEAELFGDEFSRGILQDHASDQTMRDELLAYWQEQRPRGEQAERDHLAWCETCKASRLSIAEKRREAEAEIRRKALEHAEAAA